MTKIKFPNIGQMTNEEAIVWYTSEVRRVVSLKTSEDKFNQLNQLMDFKVKLNKKLKIEMGKLKMMFLEDFEMAADKLELEASQLTLIEKSVSALDELVVKLYDKIDECTDSDKDFVRVLFLRKKINEITEFSTAIEDKYLLV